jgi:hypothetical protein
MKLRILVLLLAIGFFFVGCAHSMIGEKVPVGNLSSLRFEKTFTFGGSGDIVTYRLENDKLVGKLVFGKKLGYSGYEIEQLTLVAWFTDIEGVILAKSSYSWKDREFDMGEELKFVMDMPQDYNKFDYVGFSYFGTKLG